MERNTREQGGLRKMPIPGKQLNHTLLSVTSAPAKRGKIF